MQTALVVLCMHSATKAIEGEDCVTILTSSGRYVLWRAIIDHSPICAELFHVLFRTSTTMDLRANIGGGTNP